MRCRKKATSVIFLRNPRLTESGGRIGLVVLGMRRGPTIVALRDHGKCQEFGNEHEPAANLRAKSWRPGGVFGGGRKEGGFSCARWSAGPSSGDSEPEQYLDPPTPKAMAGLQENDPT